MHQKNEGTATGYFRAFGVIFDLILSYLSLITEPLSQGEWVNSYKMNFHILVMIVRVPSWTFGNGSPWFSTTDAQQMPPGNVEERTKRLKAKLLFGCYNRFHVSRPDALHFKPLQLPGGDDAALVPRVLNIIFAKRDAWCRETVERGEVRTRPASGNPCDSRVNGTLR